MRSFLGIVNYLNQYSALCAHHSAPLSALTHQAVDYKPSKEYFEHFHTLMSMQKQSSGWILPKKTLGHA